MRMVIKKKQVVKKERQEVTSFVYEGKWQELSKTTNSMAYVATVSKQNIAEEALPGKIKKLITLCSYLELVKPRD